MIAPNDQGWRIDRYQAFGELNIGIDSIDLTAKAYIDFDQDQKDNNNRSAPYKVKEAKISARDGSDALFAEGTIRDLYWSRTTDDDNDVNDNENDNDDDEKGWTINSYNAKGELDLKVLALTLIHKRRFFSPMTRRLIT